MTIERRVRILPDHDACNPRTEWDCHVGRMLCWHSRYSLGDDHDYDSDDCLRQLAFEHDADLEEYVDRLENEVGDRLYDRAGDNGCETWEEKVAYADKWIRPRIDAAIEKALSDGYVILPIFVYDHSGIVLSTGPFSCPWDSGQVGWIVCDKETIDKEFDGDRERAEKALECEVEVYSQYVSGDVWGFIAEERDDEEDEEWTETDSCWGFYGSDVTLNGMEDHLCNEYKDAEVVFDYN